MFGVEVDLAIEPVPTLPQDVAMVLLDRVFGLLFARNPVPDEEAMHRANPNLGAALEQPRLDLDQGHVSVFGDQFSDASLCFDLARMSITAARLGYSLTVLQSGFVTHGLHWTHWPQSVPLPYGNSGPHQSPGFEHPV